MNLHLPDELYIYLKVKNTYRHFFQIVNLESSVFVRLYSFIMVNLRQDETIYKIKD